MGNNPRHSSQVNLPVIDIAPFWSGTTQERVNVAKVIGKVCEHLGSFMVVGHHVSIHLMRDLEGTARTFFSLSEAEKLKFYREDSGTGYLPFGVESLAASMGTLSPGDLKESLNIKASLPPERWPSRPSNLRMVWENSLEIFNELAATLMQAFALALDLPEGFFGDKINRPKSILRAVFYPGLEKSPRQDQLRASAHTDYGTITILRPEPGLQVYSKNGVWLDVPHMPAEAFVINIGDLLTRWTNDRWKATLHRVINPIPEKASRSRLSLVFLHNPNSDTVVQCVDTCVMPGDGPKYEPVLAGEYLAMRSARSREYVLK